VSTPLARQMSLSAELAETERQLDQAQRENADLRAQLAPYRNARAEIERELEGANGACRTACLDDRMAAMVVEVADIRRQLADARGEAQRTVYAWWYEPDGAIGELLCGRWLHSDADTKGRPVDSCDHAYAVTLTARKVGK